MVTEAKADHEPTLVERWLHDQQQWQRTLMAFLDSAVKNDDFLVHLGNAMRGSLLGGKPYPTAAAPGVPAQEAPADDRLDRVLFVLHQLQGQVQDALMTLDELRASQQGRSSTGPTTVGARKPAATKRSAAATRTVKPRKRRVQE